MFFGCFKNTSKTWPKCCEVPWFQQFKESPEWIVRSWKLIMVSVCAGFHYLEKNSASLCLASSSEHLVFNLILTLDYVRLHSPGFLIDQKHQHVFSQLLILSETDNLHLSICTFSVFYCIFLFLSGVPLTALSQHHSSNSSYLYLLKEEFSSCVRLR